MTSKDRRAEERAALQQLLEIHGADRTRWPARERLRFASAISEDEASASLMAEAEALDRLLDRAPRASEASLEALKERIVAAALRSQPPRLAAVAGGKAAPAKPLAGPSRHRAWLANVGEWPAAAVLAASLVLGVMLGSAGTLDSAMREVASVTGLNAVAVADTAHLALGEDVLGSSDEDLL
ncbi:MAG: hypothetical protein WC829_09325 [Hyphomicrobium sp.]|jgi:hypothetical protein